MTGVVVGLDVGGSSTRLVAARLRKGALEIVDAAAFPSGELASRLAEHGLTRRPAMVGVTGRDMILRTTQVPSVPAWQLDELMAFEVEDIAEQSGDALCADHELLTGAAAFTDEDMALLALVRRSVIEDRGRELAAAGVRVSAFTPNAIALHNAAVATDGGEGTVLVAGLRGRHADIALVHEGELLFARNLSVGGDALTEAVAAGLGVPPAKAEQAKRRLGRFAPAGARPEGTAGAVADALASGLRPLVAMLQSTVSLCRTQLRAPNLEVERVLLAGPGAAVPGLEVALTRELGVPVARFDPTEGYVVGELPELEQDGGAFAVAAGLAMMGVLPDAYRIEILSDRARRARTFRRRTVWRLAAAGALVAFLGFDGWRGAADASAAQADAARLSREVAARQDATRRYERTVAEARELSARLAAVEDLTAPGAGLVATLDLLRGLLPDELWLTSVRTQRTVVPEFGHGSTPRPVIVVEGMGREQDRDLSEAVVELTTRLRGRPDVAGVLPTMSTDSRGRFVFELRLDASLAAPPSEGAAADPEDQG